MKESPYFNQKAYKKATTKTAIIAPLQGLSVVQSESDNILDVEIPDGAQALSYQEQLQQRQQQTSRYMSLETSQQE